MKSFRINWIMAFAMLVTGTAWAQSSGSGSSSGLPIHLSNRIRVEADDNVYQRDEDEKSSFNIYEEIELILNLNFENTYLGLRYRPSLVWYSERDEGDTEFLNDLDVNFNQQFGPRVSFGISERLRAGQLPAVEDGNYRVRNDDDNIYNSFLATLGIKVMPQTRLDLSFRHQILEYDHDDRKADNYTIWVGGISLRQDVGSLNSLSADFRFQTTEYDDAPHNYRRDSDTYYVGAGWERTFSPMLIGALRGGASFRNFDLEGYDDSNDPYVEATLTFLPTPDTRLTLNLNYAVSESDVVYFLSETRASGSLNFAHDLTAKISMFLSAGYSYGDFDADYEYVDYGTFGSEDEHSYFGAARVAYQVLKNNWLELGWQYVKLDSDVQTSFDRNRVSLGWRLQLF